MGALGAGEYVFRGSYLSETTHFFAHPVGGLGRGNMCLEVPISNLRKHCSPNSRGSGCLVSEFLVLPRIGDAGTTAARRGAWRGKMPRPWQPGFPDRAKGHFGSTNDEKIQVLRMEFSTVENPSGLHECVLIISEGP